MGRNRKKKKSANVKHNGTATQLSNNSENTIPPIEQAVQSQAPDHSLLYLLEATVVEVHETYGFLLAEANAGSGVYNLSDNGSGRLFFKLHSLANPAEKIDINDSITFSLKVFNRGHTKYEVFDVALRFSRTEEQIYGSISDSQTIDETEQGAPKHHDRSLKPKINIEGMIVSCAISKQCCFVKPLTKLPGGVFKPDSFYLHLSNLAALDLNLVFGDNVQIVVNPNQAEKMRADRGVLTSLSPKGHSDVNRVVFKTLEFLKKADDDEKYLASQVYETKPIFALFGYFLNFRRVPHSEFMNPLFAILKVLSFLLARLNQQFIKEVLEFAMNNGLFDRDGLLWRLIFSCPTPVLALSRTFLNQVGDSGSRTSPLNANELFKLLLNCVEIYPNCSRKVHNLIASRASVCGHEVLLGLVRVLSQPYARREDTTHRELKLVPTNDELQQFILNEEGHLNLSNLRPVIERGPYESVEGYIETYFNLLRFDCFYNFLVGLKNYMKGNHDSRDISVYKNGYLQGIGLDKQSAAITFTIVAKIEAKNQPDQNQLKRYFLYGNLVAVFVTESSLVDPIWTTVNHKNDLLPDGFLPVNLTFSKHANSKTFLECFQALVQNSGNFLLVESPTYYQSYWPVLKALQNLCPLNLPFREELVDGVEFLDPLMNEAYSLDDGFDDDGNSEPIVNLQKNADDNGLPMDYQTFVAKSSLLAKGVLGDVELDASQNEALIHLLDNRVAIVQGPPGTGKTFLGVQAVKVLLHRKAPPFHGPILVLTYKNHALDEFSKHVIKEVSATSCSRNGFIRVGGQSKDEHMAHFSLRNALGRASLLESDLHQNLEKFSETFLIECDIFETKSKILDLEALKRNLSTAQIAIMIEAFVASNPKLLNILRNLEVRFNGITNMAIVIYKLQDKREHKPGIDELERLFTQAIHAWLPQDEFISKLIEVERRKVIIEQQKLFAKSTEVVTGDEIVDAEDMIDTEEFARLAEIREELSTYGLLGSGLERQQLLTFGVDREKNRTRTFCRRHYGSLTKLFASRVNVTDFKFILNLYDMSSLERFQFLQAMLVKQCEVASAKLKTSFDQYEALAMQVRKVTSSREVEVLKRAKIVAMTITGAAIRNEILNTVKPSVIIVEEAAEISEAHLMALLGSHVKHLMLIGDHKQLRPQVECYNLVKKYHFDISMMERMINNKLPFATLANQNRMRPDISKYLIDIYPELRDSTRVLDNPRVTGLQKNFFFWDHGHEEKKGRSPVNPVEAEAAIELTKYLCDFNGYSLNQITILSGYKGQTAVLRKMARSLGSEGQRLDVQTIDMFQGDENEIVIVSTTRSNPEKRPGFMGILNRRCVAQSRGKSGVYFLGNAETLSAMRLDGNQRKNEVVWSPFFGALKEDGCYGDELILECKNHKEVTKSLNVGDQFPTRMTCFCMLVCPVENACGKHMCKKKCQPYHDESHSKCEEYVPFDFRCGKHSTEKKCYIDAYSMLCQNDCDFKFHAQEENGSIGVHPCTEKCEPVHTHDRCYTKINFSCAKNGHPLKRRCFESPTDITCKAKVSFVFKFCGVHEGEARCFEKEDSKICLNRCLKVMDPCNHPCERNCEPSHDHDSVLMACKVRIGYSCDQCGSPKFRLCYQKDSDIRCEKVVEFVFPKCGRHKSTRKCYTRLEDQICPDNCDIPLPNCSHRCKKPCRDEHLHDSDNHKCEEKMFFQHRCKETLTRLCWQSEEDISCDKPCKEILSCGHRCHLPCDPVHDHKDNPSIICRHKVQGTCENCGNSLSKLCFEKLDSSKCSAEVKFKHSCGFEMLKPCNKPENEIFCKGPCVEKLKCGHRCVYKCGSVHNHDYPCLKNVEFLCKSCSVSLKKKCSENEDDIKCSGQMKHQCPKCNVESNGPCDRSGRTFECRFSCVQTLKCGHICSQKCYEVCSEAKCKTCMEAQKERERIESEKREARKRREIEDKKSEIRNELRNTPSNPHREVLQYDVSPDSEESDYFEVRDLVLKYLQVQNGYMVKINSVTMISNLWAKRKQTEKQLKLHDPTNKKTLCYLTTEFDTKSYIDRGFHHKFQTRERRRASGISVCFPTSAEVRFKNENFIFTVVVGDVLVGRAKSITSLKNVQINMHFDSVFYANKSVSEISKYFIFDPVNVVVTYLVKFTLEPIKSLPGLDDGDKNLRNGKFQKIRLEPSRNLMIDDQKQYYYRLAESQFLRWCKGNRNESLKSVDLFFNPDLEEKFNKKKAEFESSYKDDKDTKEIFAFHGTPIDDPDIIMKGNFRLDLIKAFAHGYGIYFSEYPATSLGYASTTGNLILARVLLGKSVASNTCQKMSSRRRESCSEHDSHTVNPGKDGYANMVIIQNVDQILPMFIIKTGYGN